MKNPILVSILVISILLNGAGVVFLILFLGERGHYKSLQRQKDALSRNLDVATSGNKISQAVNSDSFEKRIFVSHLDGQVDYLGFQPPQFVPATLDYTLLVYLHGMGSTYLEPFVAAPGESSSIAATLSRIDHRVGILSCSCRKEAAWGNDAAVSDILQNIREVMQEYPFKRIVIMGTSMGGCVALNFAATAPDDIKSKIAGVAAFESAGSLSAVFATTKNKLIRPAMMLALGGAPNQVPEVYARKSFLNNIEGLPHSARVYMLSRRADQVVQPDLQKAVIQALNQRSIQNHLEEMDGEHAAPPPQVYEKGLRYVLGDNSN